MSGVTGFFFCDVANAKALEVDHLVILDDAHGYAGYLPSPECFVHQAIDGFPVDGLGGGGRGGQNRQVKGGAEPQESGPQEHYRFPFANL